jgi:hypothetical protein
MKIDFSKTTPDAPQSPYQCGVCKDEGAIGTGLSDFPIDVLESMTCPACGGAIDYEDEEELDAAIRERYPDWQ